MEDHRIIVEQEHTTVMAHYEALPREQLAMRGKQYEYYRNQLLTFE